MLSKYQNDDSRTFSILFHSLQYFCSVRNDGKNFCGDEKISDDEKKCSRGGVSGMEEAVEMSKALLCFMKLVSLSLWKLVSNVFSVTRH